jgi:glycine/D-amino acid oxidase-like deaminating enzyme
MTYLASRLAVVKPSASMAVPRAHLRADDIRLHARGGPADFNTLDHNPAVGRHPRVPNFIFANGFSGEDLRL